MANSKYAYVRQFEQPDSVLPNTWIVIRIDGRSFHRFSSAHSFVKPNDIRALHLMNEAAKAVFRDVQDVVFAYGQSDEFSFVLPPHSTLFDRRASKLISTVVSTFTAYYILYWPRFFQDTSLTEHKPSLTLFPSRDPSDAAQSEEEPGSHLEGFEVPGPAPTFDARAVAYPSVRNLRDYISWRQADCHINNLYNTTFWALVQQGGLNHREAEQELQGTFAADKNEILFSRFGINYNNEPALYRKGSVLFRDTPGSKRGEATADAKRQPDPTSKTQQEKQRKRAAKATIAVEHVDVIEDVFWEARPWILGGV